MKKVLTAAVALVAAVTALGAGVASAAPVASAPRFVGAFPNQDSNANGGYLLYSNGTVTPVGGAAFYGNGVNSGYNNFVSLVSDSSDPGYWLITATGKVVSLGTLCSADGETLQGVKVSGPIVGAVNSSGSFNEGFEMVNAAGATFQFACNFNF